LKRVEIEIDKLRQLGRFCSTPVRPVRGTSQTGAVQNRANGLNCNQELGRQDIDKDELESFLQRYGLKTQRKQNLGFDSHHRLDRW
jgi:hypothetical protein